MKTATRKSRDKDRAAMEARRLEGARLLKRGLSQADVARRLGVTRQTVHYWAARLALAKGAIGALKARKHGRPRRLDAEDIHRLRKMIVRGGQAAGFSSERWTIERVRLLVRREFGVKYSGAGCRGLLLSIGFRLHKPRAAASALSRGGEVQWRLLGSNGRST
jgi:transposase